MPETPPLVIVGIDAGDPAVLEPLAARGELPVLHGLMERGLHGRTGGPELVSEHGVWLSLFSGVSRREHGYHYFRQLVPGTYDLVPVRGADLGVQPFWAHLRDSGRRVGVIDAPDLPLVAGLHGFQLCEWATHQNVDPSAYPVQAEPSELLDRVRAEFGGKQITREDTRSTPADDGRTLRALLERVERKGRLVRALGTREPLALLVAVFCEAHAAAHQFWRYQPALPHGVDGGPELADAIPAVYRAIDREVGALLAALPADANVVVVTSVGLEDDYPTTHLVEEVLRRLGYEHPAPGGPGGGPLDLARRILPEPWRVAASRVLSRARREGLLAADFRRRTDWSRTRAFAVPSAYTSFLRLNLKGREPEGIVEPGGEAETLLDALERDLRALTVADTGERAVTDFVRTSSVFGRAASPALPDAFVEWCPGREVASVLHPGAGRIDAKRPDFFRRSDHSAHGFVAAAGPSVPRRGDVGEITVLDLAPTFLSLLGEEPPPHLRGGSFL